MLQGGYFLSDLKKDKCAIVLSFCSVVGWLTFVIGFGIHEHNEDGWDVNFRPTNFPYWLLTLIGIPGLVLHLVYGCTQKVCENAVFLFVVSSIFMSCIHAFPVVGEQQDLI